jgi:DNA transposition AAA+ family ATPase
MEQLLSFPEEMGIGLAFLGNLTLYKALHDRKLVQLTSRANGATVIAGIPDEKEVDAHIAALGVSGRSEREFCQLIGQQDGGLRFLYATVRKASEIAAGMGNAPLDTTLLKIAAARVGCWTAA